MEVRPLQAVDLLLRGGRHRPPALQHHPHAKEHLLPVQVGLQQAVRQDQQVQEGDDEDGESKRSFRVRAGANAKF